VGAQVRRAPGQQQRRCAGSIAARNIVTRDESDGDRGPLQRGHRFGGGQPREGRAMLGNIPSCGIIEWPDHPA
jgi:hypothetical protein